MIQSMGGQQGGAYGGMQGYGGYSGMSPPNVQPVQFASLQMQQANPEAGTRPDRAPKTAS